jgi:iron complex outermembrane receptor protein
VAGLRYDLDTFINPTVSPRGSLIYTPWENHTFRAGVSVGYRPPTIFESRFFGGSRITLPPFPPISGGFLVGSNQLAPEQIISYDAGYQGWYWKHRIRVRLDLFYNHISDLITNSNLSNPPTFFNGGTQGFQGQGGGSADIYGGEAGIEVLATSWLSAFANYSYQELNQTYRLGNNLSSNRVARGAPRFKANVGARAEFDNGLNGEAVLHYVGSAQYPIDPGFAAFLSPPFTIPATLPPDTRVGSYVLVNLRGAYKVWREKPTGREAELAVTVFNALNDKHKEHPLGETIGSRVMGWLTIRY